MSYKINQDFGINVGFTVNSQNTSDAVDQTNSILCALPATLFKSIDYKTTSAIIGAVFCDAVASLTEGIVNPIEKGHPDIIPSYAAGSTEEQLRKYPKGLEIKCTVGGIEKGANLRAGSTRIDRLTGITWQAHHREVDALMGLVWDFVDLGDKPFNAPAIVGVFYSNTLIEDDWGKISGLNGRNTKVTGLSASGKAKMGLGWVAVMDDERYINKFKRFLKVPM